MPVKRCAAERKRNTVVRTLRSIYSDEKLVIKKSCFQKPLFICYTRQERNIYRICAVKTITCMKEKQRRDLSANRQTLVASRC